MNALVTGGGGFLGAAIVRHLRERGDRVHSLSRRRYAELDALDVIQHQSDIADVLAVSRAAADCDIVFHIAAKAGIGGRYRDYHRANVVGTANVLTACRHHGISRLVYTSSPSVVFAGRDMAGVNESMPYPSHYEAAYPQTKAIAERMVLQANGIALATVSLRPHLIWGPGDNHLIPRLLTRAAPAGCAASARNRNSSTAFTSTTPPTLIFAPPTVWRRERPSPASRISSRRASRCRCGISSIVSCMPRDSSR